MDIIYSGFMLFIILIGLGVVFIMLSSVLEAQKVNTGVCKPHKWVSKEKPDELGYLICSKCGQTPGVSNE